MRILALDIETVPQRGYTEPESYVPWGGDVELDEKYIEELAGEREILAHEIKAGQAVLKATGLCAALHPTTASLVACNYGWVSEKTGEVKTDVAIQEADRTELMLVLEAFQRLADAIAKPSLIVGFHSKSFDLPMLRMRAALLGARDVARLPWKRLLYPYDQKDVHCDLRMVLNSDARWAKGTLQHWADAFGIHAEEHGQDVFGWYREGNWDAIRAYGASEGKTLVELFQRVESVL